MEETNTSKKIYYYLDGAEKKGPFTKNEMIDLNLPKNTLIYSEGQSEWIPISETRAFGMDDRIQKNDGVLVPKSKISSLLIFIILAIITTSIAHFITTKIINEDYEKFEESVNDIFKGKYEIFDLWNVNVKGDLIRIDDEEYKDVEFPTDDEGNELYEYFDPKHGGWIILKLTKLNNGYVTDEISSLGMGFKVGETVFEPGFNFGGGVSSRGYNRPSKRGTVQDAYDDVLEGELEDLDESSFTPGSYNTIFEFLDLRSELHMLENRETSDFKSLEVIGKSWGENVRMRTFNKKWIVYTNEIGKYYEIVPNWESCSQLWITNAGIGIILSLIIVLLRKFRKPLGM